MAKVELVSRENNTAHLTVQLEAAEVNQQFRRVYKEAARELSLPGFRKGKVPPNVVRQRLGSDTINSAAADHLKEFAIDEALTQLGLSPRQGQTRWHSDPDPKENEVLAYELSIPVLPDVTLPDYRNYELTVPKLVVTDAMKDRYRERLAERHTEFEPKDGAAADGDALQIAFSTRYVESGEDCSFKHDKLMYILGREGNLPGWDEHLAGHQTNDTVEFEYDMPENFADSRVAGKKLTVRVNVHQVNAVQTPQIDEAFIKQKLHMDSMDEFEKYIESALTYERDAQLNQMKRELSMQKLIEDLQAEISEDMITSEIDGLVKENDHTLRRYDSNLEQYLKEKNQSLQEYRDSLKPVALNKIKLFLAVKTIAEVESLTATAEDFQRYAHYLMQQEGLTAEQLKALVKEPEFANEATYQIVKDKALDHVARSARFTEEERSLEEQEASLKNET